MITGGNNDGSPRLPPQTVALLPLIVLVLLLLQTLYMDCTARYIPEHFFTCEFPSRPDHFRLESPGTMTIEIRVDDTVSIAGILTEPHGNSDLPVLRRHLSVNRDAINKHGGLIVRPEPDVRMQRLMDVISAVKGSGISYYGLQ